jgi:hypothetical protein
MTLKHVVSLNPALFDQKLNQRLPPNTQEMDIKRRQYQSRMVLVIFGMSWGSVSFGYASAIIATTLGKYPARRWHVSLF